MMWTPFQIRIVLHHYSSTAACESSRAPIYAETVARLVDLGVLEWRPECAKECAAHETPFCTTPMGRGLIEMWCQQPLPIVTYVDPRFAEGQTR